MISMDEYQIVARRTAIYPDQYKVIYPLMGLAGEVGELLNKYKKVIRDGIPVSTKELVDELGDILWYLSNASDDLNINLDLVAQNNLNKLASRAKRGTLQGSGDER